MLDAFGLINMNGRVYDPVIARFLSPDNYVQSPTSSQGFNRYSYCLNNPLVYTDPSGEILVPILIGAAIGVITNGINNTVNDQPFFQGAGRAAIIGGISGAFAYGIGQAAMGLSGFEKVAFQTLAHGHLGGIMSGMSGGTYGQGFLSGSAGSLIGGGASSLLQNSGPVFQAIGTVSAGALAGGIGAEIMGGNFWDGARNGAISAGLNHAVHAGFLGQDIMIASITGRARHLFGPDAIAFAATLDLYFGTGAGFEKGGLVILRGKDQGLYDFNDIGVGPGTPAFGVGAEAVKLYSSAYNVLKSHFYGPRWEGNISASVSAVSLGAAATFATHAGGKGFTIGLGYSLGLSALPIPIFGGININRGASTEKFIELNTEMKNAFSSWW